MGADERTLPTDHTDPPPTRLRSCGKLAPTNPTSTFPQPPQPRRRRVTTTPQDLTLPKRTTETRRHRDGMGGTGIGGHLVPRAREPHREKGASNLRRSRRVRSRRRAASARPPGLRRWGRVERIRPLGGAHGVRAYRGGVEVKRPATSDGGVGECRRAARPHSGKPSSPHALKPPRPQTLPVGGWICVYLRFRGFSLWRVWALRLCVSVVFPPDGWGICVICGLSVGRGILHLESCIRVGGRGFRSGGTPPTAATPRHETPALVSRRR